MHLVDAMKLSLEVYFTKKPRNIPHALRQSNLKGETDNSLNLLVISLDSVSRKHFFRKMPKLIEKLNSL